MNILICIPVVKNGVVLRECVDQILYKRNVHILILDNGADPDVKEALYHYDQYPQVTIWHNSINKFVTEPWNTFLDHFIKSEYDRLIIMNSDITLNKEWWDVCIGLFKELPGLTIVPTISDDKRLMYEKVKKKHHIERIPENKGIPGIFITFSKLHAKAIYPIPSDIKVWFGDAFIYELLYACNYSAYIASDLLCFHHTSTNVNSIEGIHKIIEEDKIAWNTKVKAELEKRIEKLKNEL